MKAHTFEDAVKHNLPYIDEILIHDRIALNLRPVYAAFYFTQEIIIEIKGDTKDNFIEKPWFKTIVDTSTKWYVAKYGKSVLELDKDLAVAVVGINNTPLKLSVPLTISKIEKPGETRWITFADTILPGEDVLKFICMPPDFAIMKKREIERLRNTISLVVVDLRCINVNLCTAYFKNEIAHKMAKTIKSHIYTSAKHILSKSAEEQQLAFWEMQMAIEKALKALMMQKKIPVPKTHDLKAMVEIVIKNIKPGFDCRILNKYPSAGDAISLRYGETAPKYDAVLTYYKMLNIIKKITGAMERKIVLNNASILIRKAPWL